MLLLRYLYSVWSGLVFLALLLVAVLVYSVASVFGRRGFKYMLGYNKIWVNTWAALTGVRFKITDNPNVKKSEPYVFVVNHTSMGDAVLVNAALKHNNFTPLAKAEIKKMPLMGYVFSKVSVFVQRDNPESRRKSIEQMLDHAKHGISVLIFPEGTRNKKMEQPLMPFHAGAFRIAIETQLPIAPLIIIGANDLMPNEKLPIRPCTMRAIFADPIETKGMTEADVPALQEKVYQIMLNLLLTHHPKFKQLANTHS